MTIKCGRCRKHNLSFFMYEGILLKRKKGKNWVYDAKCPQCGLYTIQKTSLQRRLKRKVVRDD